MSDSPFTRSSAQDLPVRQIPRLIAIGNNKGGVGKTSLTANIGGLFANAGHKVLIIDFDPQGNLRRDLGYEQDSGADLLQALITQQPLPVTENVRENLDVVKGGQEMRALTFHVMSKGGNPAFLASWLTASLEPIAERYDLILVDTSPGEHTLVQGVLSVASGLIITTNSDDASKDGFVTTADLFVNARELNPDLALVGAVMFNIGSGFRKIARETRESLEGMLGNAAPVFGQWIRSQVGAAKDARAKGLLVHEMEAQVQEASRERLRALREGKPVTAGFYSSNVSGLAEDYARLAEEILIRINELEAGEEAVNA